MIKITSSSVYRSDEVIFNLINAAQKFSYFSKIILPSSLIDLYNSS